MKRVFKILYFIVMTVGLLAVSASDINASDALTPPVIYGPKSYIKNNDTSIKAKDFIAHLEAYDSYSDFWLTNQIYVQSDNYLDTRIPGQYNITFAVKNSNNVVGTFEITVIVIDVIKPVLYVPIGSFFTSDEINTMTIQDIINVLIYTEQIDQD